MLEEECEAVATYAGELLAHSSYQGVPVSSEQGALFVSSLSLTLQSLVTLIKSRALQEVQTGRRAIPVSLDATSQDGPITQAAAYAEIDVIAQRLAGARFLMPKMFYGYVTVREGETLRVLYPAIQAHLEATQACLAHAARTPGGRFIQALSADGLQGVTLQESYPAYYVYRVQERSHPAGSWKQRDCTGRDQLVALLAEAYHKGHWFARVDIPPHWIPLGL
jgi:hypothetical protein